MEKNGRNDGKMPTREMPVILSAAEGLATAIPAAALVTETAGVSIPSAIVNPVAKRHFEWSGYSKQLKDRMYPSMTHPNKQRPAEPLRNITRTRNRLGLVCAIAGQDSVAVDVLTGGRIQPLEQGETPSLSFSGTKVQANEDL